ncbi:hypothetical protein OBBRIDRAFT_803476 [Obba rivulosa]|uniref:Uncharacterized protein n=1 Tax=Obba rivulosa TaxID=1052685 RepID=A0A8E2AVL8_9APHY|nr:hypothetical protein OBBRIDRAFT_803476 [Obba rivulosa]
MSLAYLLNGTYFITAPATGASLVFVNNSGDLGLFVQNFTGNPDQQVRRPALVLSAGTDRRAVAQWLIESSSAAYTMKNVVYGLYISPADLQQGPGTPQDLAASQQPFGWYAIPENGSFTCILAGHRVLDVLEHGRCVQPDHRQCKALSSAYRDCACSPPPLDQVALSSSADMWALTSVQNESMLLSTVPSATPSASSSAAASPHSLSIAAIAGIAAGGICGLLLIVAVVMWARRRACTSYDDDPSERSGWQSNAPASGQADADQSNWGLGPGLPLATYSPYRAHRGY